MNNVEQYKDRRYLVTGVSGFIGRAVCEKLLAAGAIVHGTSRRDVTLAARNWSHSLADLTVASAVDELFASVRPEFVIHLAGCVTGRREVEWVRATLAGNLLASVNILVAAQNSDTIKCVLAGSLEEPGDDETLPVPASPYAASKWSASGYARMMHALYGLKVAVARIFMVYGPGQEDLKKLVPYVCLAAAAGEAPKLMSGARPVDWLYIDDVAAGLIRMAHAGPDDGTHVDLGSGRLVTTGEVAVRLCRIANTGVEPELGALPDRPMEQVRVANVAATLAKTGWSVATDLEVGLAATYAWYRRLARQRQEA